MCVKKTLPINNKLMYTKYFNEFKKFYYKNIYFLIKIKIWKMPLIISYQNIVFYLLAICCEERNNAAESKCENLLSLELLKHIFQIT